MAQNNGTAKTCENGAKRKKICVVSVRYLCCDIYVGICVGIHVVISA